MKRIDGKQRFSIAGAPVLGNEFITPSQLRRAGSEIMGVRGNQICQLHFQDLSASTLRTEAQAAQQRLTVDLDDDAPAVKLHKLLHIPVEILITFRMGQNRIKSGIEDLKHGAHDPIRGFLIQKIHQQIIRVIQRPASPLRDPFHAAAFIPKLTSQKQLQIRIVLRSILFCQLERGSDAILMLPKIPRVIMGRKAKRTNSVLIRGVNQLIHIGFILRTVVYAKEHMIVDIRKLERIGFVVHQNPASHGGSLIISDPPFLCLMWRCQERFYWTSFPSASK